MSFGAGNNLSSQSKAEQKVDPDHAKSPFFQLDQYLALCSRLNLGNSLNRSLA